MKIFKDLVFAFTIVTTLSGAALAAEEGGGAAGGVLVPLYEGKPYLHVIHEGRSVKVQRVQDPDYTLRGYYAKTSRKCPPFCLKPMVVDPQVRTIGEREVFDFMEHELRDGTGLLIDARTPAWHKKGTIPGSINIPFTTLSKKITDPEMIKTLKFLGAKPRKDVGSVTRKLEEWGVLDGKFKTDSWDFSESKELVLWCNGPACGQSPRAIRGLLSVGYPPSKIHYYRGGMQIWQLFGLTTVVPEG